MSPGSIAGAGAHSLLALSLRDLDGWRVSVSDADAITVEHPDKARRYMARAGDVLVASRGTQLKAAIVPAGAGDAVVTASLIGVRPHTAVLLPEVLLAFLRSPEGVAELSARARSATGQLALTRADVERLELPLPPLEVQEKIAAIIREMTEYEEHAGQAMRLRRDAGEQAVAQLLVRSEAE
jgi:type I restriction enzyme M protein